MFAALVSGGCENGVAPEDCPLPPPGTLLEQYVYEPYGAVSVAENLHTAPDGTSLHAANRVGHQGLFFERFAGDYTTEPLSPTDGAGLYFNRNRFYSPTLGRFIQRDPNETALPILSALATNAETLAVNFGGFNAQALYANGPNLYQYEGSNPVNRRDPSGLYDDYDAEIDDLVGHRLYVLGAISDGSAGILLGVHTALNYAGGLLGIDANGLAADVTAAGGGYWQAMQSIAERDPRSRNGVDVAMAVGSMENYASSDGRSPFGSWNDRFNRVYNSIRDWERWDPSFQKVGEDAVRINNQDVLRMLHNTIPGRWKKVYIYGQDGRKIHCFRHSSGKIVAPKWVNR